MILGHAYEPLVKAIQERFWILRHLEHQTELEIEMAEVIKEHVPKY
jgi:glutamate-1-semialdehyde 2,1-aminomutase